MKDRFGGRAGLQNCAIKTENVVGKNTRTHANSYRGVYQREVTDECFKVLPTENSEQIEFKSSNLKTKGDLGTRVKKALLYSNVKSSGLEHGKGTRAINRNEWNIVTRYIVEKSTWAERLPWKPMNGKNEVSNITEEREGWTSKQKKLARFICILKKTINNGWVRTHIELFHDLALDHCYDLAILLVHLALPLVADPSAHAAAQP